MKQMWLEKMAEDGLIRKEAVAHIYSEVDTFVKEAATWDKDHLAGKVVTTAGKTLASVAGTAGLLHIANMISRKFEEKKNLGDAKSAILKSREYVVSQFSDPEDKAKAQARFHEVMLYSPNVAANPALAAKIVKDNLHSGLTDTKATMLASVQSQYNNSELSKLGTIRPEVAGEIAANDLVLSKLAAMITGSNIKDFLKTVAIHSSVPLVAGAVAGTGSYISGKLKERDLKDQLDSAFNHAVKQAPDIHKELFSTNMDAARQSFNALVHFAPHIALQPHAARAFMIRMINHYDQGGMDINDVKNLTEIEKNISMTPSGIPGFMSSFGEGAKFMSGGATGKGVEEGVKHLFEAPPTTSHKNKRNKTEDDLLQEQADKIRKREGL